MSNFDDLGIGDDSDEAWGTLCVVGGEGWSGISDLLVGICSFMSDGLAELRIYFLNLYFITIM